MYRHNLIIFLDSSPHKEPSNYNYSNSNDKVTPLENLKSWDFN